MYILNRTCISILLNLVHVSFVNIALTITIRLQFILIICSECFIATAWLTTQFNLLTVNIYNINICHKLYCCYTAHNVSHNVIPASLKTTYYTQNFLLTEIDNPHYICTSHLNHSIFIKCPYYLGQLVMFVQTLCYLMLNKFDSVKHFYIQTLLSIFMYNAIFTPNTTFMCTLFYEYPQIKLFFLKLRFYKYNYSELDRNVKNTKYLHLHTSFCGFSLLYLGHNVHCLGHNVTYNFVINNLNGYL